MTTPAKSTAKAYPVKEMLFDVLQQNQAIQDQLTDIQKGLSATRQPEGLDQKSDGAKPAASRKLPWCDRVIACCAAFLVFCMVAATILTLVHKAVHP